jgi:hypothetical protein
MGRPSAELMADHVERPIIDLISGALAGTFSTNNEQGWREASAISVVPPTLNRIAASAMCAMGGRSGACASPQRPRLPPTLTRTPTPAVRSFPAHRSVIARERDQHQLKQHGGGLADQLAQP